MPTLLIDTCPVEDCSRELDNTKNKPARSAWSHITLTKDEQHRDFVREHDYSSFVEEYGDVDDAADDPEPETVDEEPDGEDDADEEEEEEEGENESEGVTYETRTRVTVEDDEEDDDPDPSDSSSTGGGIPINVTTVALGGIGLLVLRSLTRERETRPGASTQAREAESSGREPEGTTSDNATPETDPDASADSTTTHDYPSALEAGASGTPRTVSDNDGGGMS